MCGLTHLRKHLKQVLCAPWPVALQVGLTTEVSHRAVTCYFQIYNQRVPNQPVVITALNLYSLLKAMFDLGYRPCTCHINLYGYKAPHLTTGMIIQHPPLLQKKKEKD